MIKGVIFDMDGVIIDSEPAHQETEMILFKRFNVPVQDEDLGNMKGKTDLDIFSSILRKYAVSHVSPQELLEEKLKIYPQYADNISLFPGFNELIRYLKPRYKIALATSSIAYFQQQAFNKFNLHHYFQEVVTAEDITYSKPHPEPYLLAMQRLGVNPAESIIIEDADNGITAGKSAGARVIAVTHTLPEERLRHADYIVNDLYQVRKLFEGID